MEPRLIPAASDAGVHPAPAGPLPTFATSAAGSASGAAGAASDSHAPATSLPACLLERLIGRAAATWTVDDLAALATERGVRLVSLMHVGGDGWLKALDFVPQSRAHLCDILSGGERADGSSLFPEVGLRVGASDILLRPRLESAFLDPFAALPTLVVLCGHADRTGAPLAQSPDTIIHRAGARVRQETGVELHALGEVEYFLGRRAAEGDVYGAGERGYHATSPFVFGEPLRRQAMAILAEMGVPVKYGHSEVGYVEASETDGEIWEQHEIELGLAPLVQAADGVALTHWVLRNLAHRQGMRCSFDPILRRGHAGTGLHFHLSPVRDGAHLGGRGGDGSLSREAQWLIAGLVRFGGALMAFGNRTEGSLIRLTQAKEAPSAIVWGDYDRSALVRLPIVANNAEGRPVSPPTVEFRLPDGSAHPHLLLAGVGQAMVSARASTDVAELLVHTSTAALKRGERVPTAVPTRFLEVAEALAAQRAAFEAGGVFPPVLIDQVIARLSA
jgi:glutamine synthetase